MTVTKEQLIDVLAKGSTAVSEINYELEQWALELELFSDLERFLCDGGMIARINFPLLNAALFPTKEDEYKAFDCQDCGAVGLQPCVPGCPNLDGLLDSRVWRDEDV